MLYIIHSGRRENKLLDVLTRLCPDAQPQFCCRAGCVRACVCFAGGICLGREKNKYKNSKLPQISNSFKNISLYKDILAFADAKTVCV